MVLRKEIEQTLKRWRLDRMAFRREAILLEDGTRFGDRMEAWQEEDFRAMDAHAGNVYRELPRGHSKTFDLAIQATVDLVLGPRNQRNYCCGADQDQAMLLFNDVCGIFRRNPVLAPSAEILKKEIRMKSTGSVLIPLAADVPGAFGLRPDRVYADEIAEWPNDGLWVPLYTASGKRPHCRIFVISTAGWDRTSIGWQVREIARTESSWLLISRRQCASWISKAWLEQQARTLPRHVFARLHDCLWVDGVGAFLTHEEVNRVFAEIPAGEGPAAIGLDLGVQRDRSVATVVQKVGDRLVVRAIYTWDPKNFGGRVNLTQVEEEVAALAQKHQLPIFLDPWQANLLSERLKARGIRCEEFKFTSESRRMLFTVLLDLIRTGRLHSIPHQELRTELLGLEVSETAAGWRVDHRVGKHDDHVVAVGLATQALVAAHEIPRDALFLMGNSSGPLVSSVGYKGFSAFDEVEQRAQQAFAIWNFGNNKLDWD